MRLPGLGRTGCTAIMTNTCADIMTTAIDVASVSWEQKELPPCWVWILGLVDGFLNSVFATLLCFPESFHSEIEKQKKRL